MREQRSSQEPFSVSDHTGTVRVDHRIEVCSGTVADQVTKSGKREALASKALVASGAIGLAGAIVLLVG